MTTRPIPLRAWQVSAALDDRLSVLVVALKPQPDARSVRPLGFVGSPAKFAFTLCHDGGANSTINVPLPMSVGDRLWAREAFAIDSLSPAGVRYYATDGAHELRRKRSPVIMPRRFSRLTLDVTEVRVCRLHEVTEDEALAAGVTKVRDSCHVIRGFDYDKAGLCHTSPITAFAKWWDSVHVADAWFNNPWVCVARLTVHHRNIDSIAPRGNQCVANLEGVTA